VRDGRLHRRDAHEDHREDDRVQDGHEERPAESHHGLLVAEHEIAPRHRQEQLAVLDLLVDHLAQRVHHEGPRRDPLEPARMADAMPKNAVAISRMSRVSLARPSATGNPAAIAIAPVTTTRERSLAMGAPVGASALKHWSKHKASENVRKSG